MKKLFICLLSLFVLFTFASTNIVKAENAEIPIDTMDKLVDFLVDKGSTTTNAKLTDNIYFDDQNPLTLVNEVHIGVNKTLDLNGYNIYFGDCLGIDAYNNINVTITNTSNTTSYLMPMEESSNILSFAMIATRLSQQDITFNLNITGNIVIDGNNKSNYAGLCVGYSNPLPHEPGYYNSKHIVTLKDVEVRNFKPNNIFGVGAALVNLNGQLDVVACNIHNNMIGIGTTHFNQETFKPVTNVQNTENSQVMNIHDNGIGIANGLDVKLPNPFEAGEFLDLTFVPGELTVAGLSNDKYAPVYIYGNDVGMQLGSKDIENDKGLHKLGPKVYWRSPDWSSYNEKDVYLVNDAVITAINNANGDFGIYLDKYPKMGDYRKFVIGELDGLVKPNEKGIIYSNAEGSFLYHQTPNESLHASARLIKEGKEVKLWMNVGSDVTDVNVIEPWGKVETAVIEDGVAKITVVPEHEGEFAFRYVKNGNDITSNSITIKFGELPVPSPDKKDESCEKVIGPTWHWNNTKGICEDVGVVGTYTR